MGEKHTSIRLRALNVPGRGSPIEISGDGLLIGREKSSDVVVASVDFPHVSSRHARFHYVDGELFVEDLGSKNGTMVDGKTIAQPHATPPGSIVQLGYRGPKFLVISDQVPGDDLDVALLETVDAAPSSDGIDRDADTIARVKQALGLPAERGVDDLLRARSRRNAVVALIVIAIVGVGAYLWRDARRTDADEVGNALRELLQQREQIEARLLAMEELRDHLQRQGEALRSDLDTLRAAGGDQSERAQELQRTLEGIEADIERISTFDPATSDPASIGAVGAVKEVSAAIARVRPAVVRVDMITHFRQKATGELLYRDEDRYNFDRRGVLVSAEDQGTGVCISERGEVLTNAHVVEVAVLDLSVHGFPHVEVVTDYRVTFVEGVNSHSARVLRRPSGADAPDLAVLGIEPFPGMPFVQGFRSDVTPAADGDRVMMLGFPYRTFRVYEGVVTRWRSPDGHDYLMFDRPVHPGASGSPLVDPTGAIVGIAKGRLENPDTGEPIESGGISIPIGDVRSVWP